MIIIILFLIISTHYVQTIEYVPINLLDVVDNVKRSTISSTCSKQLDELLNNYEQALFKMADAWSKFPYTGLLEATRRDYGNYDECISIKIHTNQSGTILGKHCAFGLIVPDISRSKASEMIANAWKLSYCVPHLCSAADLNNLTNTSVALFNDAVCSTKDTDTELDLGAQITIGIFCTFALFLIMSTIYDIVCWLNEVKPNPILRAFSVYTNLKSLLASSSKPSKDQILCFNGIKFISIWWIMAGHSAGGWLILPVTDEQRTNQWQNTNYSEYIMQAHLAVDSFFFISGFLLAYLYLKNTISKRSFLVQLKALPSIILYRYLRLTPAILMLYLFVSFLFKYMGDGPLFAYRVDGALTEPCRNHWCAVFLYIQNYYIFNLGEELCITTLWYVNADMQLFLLAPIVLIPAAILYKKSFKSVLISLAILNLVFVILPIFTKIYWKSYDPNFSEYDTHSRLIDYFIGLTMGIFMHHRRASITIIKKKLNTLAWVITLITMLAIVLVTQEINLNYGYLARTFCYSLTRPLWCLGLCWITFACSSGYGGVIDWLLSNKCMQLGGKLTYCLYLVHGPIITYYALVTRNRRYFSDYLLFYDWCGHFIVSFMVATLWTLAFEMPMLTVERVVFHRSKDERK